MLDTKDAHVKDVVLPLQNIHGAWICRQAIAYNKYKVQ